MSVSDPCSSSHWSKIWTLFWFNFDCSNFWEKGETGENAQAFCSFCLKSLFETHLFLLSFPVVCPLFSAVLFISVIDEVNFVLMVDLYKTYFYLIDHLFPSYQFQLMEKTFVYFYQGKATKLASFYCNDGSNFHNQ